MAALEETYKGLKKQLLDVEELSQQRKRVLDIEEAKVDKLNKDIGVIKQEKEAATQVGLRLEQDVERLTREKETLAREKAKLALDLEAFGKMYVQTTEKHVHEVERLNLEVKRQKAALANTQKSKTSKREAYKALQRIEAIVGENPSVTLIALRRQQILQICQSIKGESASGSDPESVYSESNNSDSGGDRPAQLEEKDLQARPVADRPPSRIALDKPLNAGSFQTPRSNSSNSSAEKHSDKKDDSRAPAKSDGSASTPDSVKPADFGGSAKASQGDSDDSEGKASDARSGSASDEARLEPDIVGLTGPMYGELHLPGEADSD